MTSPHIPMVRLLLCALTLPMCCSSPAQTAPLDLNTLGKGIVKIHVTHAGKPGRSNKVEETGTGIVVRESGGVMRILTAKHVVENVSKIEVSFAYDPGLVLTAQVLPSASDDLDLAMIDAHASTATALPADIHPLPWAANSTLHTTEHIWTVNGEGEPAPNNITRLDNGGNAQRFEYTQVAVGEGYSGAPVFDDAGRLIGIHVESTSRSDYSVAVAVKAESALATMAALGYQTATLNLLHGPAAVPASASGPSNAPVKGGLVPNSQINSAGITSIDGARSTAGGTLWRCTGNNELYRFRTDGDHLYIQRRDGAVVGDLTKTRDKKGAEKFVGTSNLSDCPYIEITTFTDTRIEGRIEHKNNNQCAGTVTNSGSKTAFNFVNFFRQLGPVSFIPEQ